MNAGMESPNAAPFTLHNGLAVYRFGDGQPLFLMPGPHRFSRPGERTFDALIEGFVRLGRQVITYDPPESGQSTRAMRLSMAEMHDCADEALSVCGVSGPLDCADHSMGGLALVAYAVERPARAARLVLIGTGAGNLYMRAPGALWNRTHPAFWRMALLGMAHMAVPTLALQNLMLNFIERRSFQDPAQAAPEPVRPRAWLRRKEGRTDWHRIAVRLNYADRLHEIRSPALILCGRHDPQFAPACSEELAARIPDARLVYFERSGHYPFIEEAQDFWRVAGGFLSG